MFPVWWGIAVWGGCGHARQFHQLTIFSDQFGI
jgi:hypothetical protein